MPKEKPELSEAMKKKLGGKTFIKNPIPGTKYTIAISSAKGVGINMFFYIGLVCFLIGFIAGFTLIKFASTYLSSISSMNLLGSQSIKLPHR